MNLSNQIDLLKIPAQTKKLFSLLKLIPGKIKMGTNAHFTGNL